MSGSFSGFSEDDIRKLSHKNPEELTKSHSKGNVQGRPELKQQKHSSKKYQTNSDLRNKILNEKIQNSHIEPLPEGAKLTKVLEVASGSNVDCDTSKRNPQSNIPSCDQNSQLNTSLNAERSGKTPEGEQNVQLEGKTKEKEAGKEVILQEKRLDLEEFQTKQKLIEEQNKKRKELLVRALAVKTKQTQEETQKLNKVREELKKIDNLLSDDVKLLRKQIEVASVDYMEAQKKYFRKEREYLDAKLFLQKTLDRKEMLTEHLAAIIQMNEERKAEKLNELLSKLNLRGEVQNASADVTKIDDMAKQIDNNLPVTSDNTNNSRIGNLEQK